MATRGGLASGSGMVRASVGVFITLAGVSCALTLLFLGMRSVMEIGGACAEGGPFVPRRPCPKGIPLVMVGSIWGGLIFIGLYVWQSSKHGAPSLVLLAWPALFISLGWNFLDYGLDPPGGGGLVWGWLVPGGLFMLMGGGPLLLFGGTIGRRFRGPPVTSSTGPGWGDLVKQSIATARTSTASTTMSGRDPDVVAKLERLDSLHRSGALGDDEFDAAKRTILGI